MSATSHRHPPRTRGGSGAPAAPSPPPRGRRRSEVRTLIGEARRGELHVMSFDIGLDTGRTDPADPAHWPTREPLVSRLLELEQPTLLGAQGALFHQLRSIEDGLPQRYRMIGAGSEGGSHGEHCPVFYDPLRVRLEAWEQWWLSDCPDRVGSVGWDADRPRVALHARFVELATERAFCLLNTRLDPAAPEARRQATTMLVRRLRECGLPTVVTGDVAGAGDADSTWELVRTAHLTDSWSSASQRVTPLVGTRHGYAEPQPDAPRVDWVLTSPAVRVLQAGVNTTAFLGRRPSDHAPVQALLRL
ncbi:endonuclease/exonuclease/phosphatase family protein [Desertihabitans brevis]|uniref:endonuclease/exonuclease/phosphatase family protein n=1 Tax=Desertihabitans brevis TaxID=2268447 RepID=UPI0011BF8238|nr:endonuclease/exonuclease/phosphatase family protein [Desertihabitans brevis]